MSPPKFSILAICGDVFIVSFGLVCVNLSVVFISSGLLEWNSYRTLPCFQEKIKKKRKQTKLTLTPKKPAIHK